MMIDDHTKAGDHLKQIATSNSIPIDTQIDDKQQNLMDKLSKLNGGDFDKEYMSAMVDDHRDAVEQHLDRAKEIKDNVDHPGNQIERTVSSRWSSPAALSSV